MEKNVHIYKKSIMHKNGAHPAEVASAIDADEGIADTTCHHGQPLQGLVVLSVVQSH